MAILAGVSEYSDPDFELAGAKRHVVAVLLLLLLHYLLWLAWPGLRWQAQPDSGESFEVRWIKPLPPASVQAPSQPAQVTPARLNKLTYTTAPTQHAGTTSVVKPTPITLPTQASTIKAAETNSVDQGDPLAKAAPVTGLDLDQVRGAARQMGKQYQPDTIAQIQESHRRDQRMETQLGQNVAKAAKKECLKAYSGIGILAVIPLAVSAVVDTGCKW